MKKNYFFVFISCLLLLVAFGSIVSAHEEDAEYHALPLEAKIGNVFKRMTRAFTDLFSGKKADRILQTPAQPAPTASSEMPKQTTPLENKPAAGAPQAPISGSGAGVGTAPSAPAPQTGQAKRGGTITPTTPQKSGGEKASGGATTIFEGQKTSGLTEGPITGGGIGETAPKSTIQPTEIIQAKPTKLILENSGTLQGIKETDLVAFKAMLVMNDGTKKDVTAEAKWTVVGPIGAMEKPGIFRAKLDASVSEAGEGFGSIIAGWKDSAGTEFSANSAIFKVEAYYGEDLGPQEGNSQTKNFFGNLLKTIMFWK